MVKFGIYLPRHLDYGVVKKAAKDCERLGYYSVWLADHNYPPIPPCKLSLECWTTITALALETEKLRVGSSVLSVMFRHPPLLARMAATLDIISGGRLEFGIGGGNWEEETTAFGLPFPKAPERMERLREAVKLIREVWTKEKVTFEGKFYKMRDAICSPKPIQKPNPPIWIGGQGEKYSLRIVAEQADGWMPIWVHPEDYKRKLKVLADYCKEIGRKPSDVQLGLMTSALLVRNHEELKMKIDKIDVKEYLGEQGYKDNFESIVGTAEECVKKIRAYIDMGVEYFILEFPEICINPDVVELESLEHFSEQVIPQFRKD